LTVKDIKGNAQGELEVKFSLIENGRGTEAVHQAIVAYNAAQRMGTACTKNAGEVAGTNKKPWRQKGTGRARAGSFQSPLWRGGGVVFGPKPRDFSKKVGRTTRQLALRKAISERIKAGDVLVVNDFNLASAKTRDFVAVLDTLQVDGTALIVSDTGDQNLLLAARNVGHVEVTSGESLNTYQILRSDKLVFTRGAFEQLEKRLAE
ncbi:MAG TPA: 50S ribosomal protein L4, partial [Verrucomicrobiae bacterium]|nr:50S ribosomal protein L4 [Verrucomicrobiae bacterium]